MDHKFNIRVVFLTTDTLSVRLVKIKPKTDKINKKIVCAIPCMCGKSYIGETGRTLDIKLNEHKNSLIKGKITTSKLVEHTLNEVHIFERDKTSVLARESKWKARKFHKAALIYLGGDQVVSAPSMDIDPIWRPVLDDYNKIIIPLAVNIFNINLRRSARLKAKEGTKR
jgi:HKD family nuclease